MTVEAAAAVISFIGLFTAWVIVPSRLKKKHASRAKDNASDQSAQP